MKVTTIEFSSAGENINRIDIWEIQQYSPFAWREIDGDAPQADYAEYEMSGTHELLEFHVPEDQWDEFKAWLKQECEENGVEGWIDPRWDREYEGDTEDEWYTDPDGGRAGVLEMRGEKED